MRVQSSARSENVASIDEPRDPTNVRTPPQWLLLMPLFRIGGIALSTQIIMMRWSGIAILIKGGRAKKRKKMENGKGKEEQKQHVKCKARGRDLLNLKPF